MIEDKIGLAKNEVAELIGITVEEGPVTVNPGDALSPPDGDKKPSVPVPVIRDVC